MSKAQGKFELPQENNQKSKWCWTFPHKREREGKKKKLLHQFQC